MKKRLAVLLAALMCLSLVLVGCSGGVEKTDAPAADASTAAPATDTSGAAATEPTGDVVELSLTHHDPPESATGKFLDAWAATIKDASNGEIDIQVMHGGSLAGPKESLDMCKSGAVDIAWSLQAFYPGIFPMTEVMALPMMGIESAAQGSAALWDLYENTDYLDEEYSDVHVLLIHTNCDSPISTKGAPLSSIDDLQGMNVRTNSGPPTTFMQKLGSSPQDIAITDLYSSIEKSVLDAVVTDWHAINSFKLYEQLTDYLDAHVQVSPYFLVMNQAKWDSLTPEQQEVINSCSGANALEIAGSSWDDVQTAVQEKIEEQGNNIYTLDEAEMKKLQDTAQEVKDEWIAAAGENGQAVYDAAVAAIAAAA